MRDAVLQSMPEDRGLFMPESIPVLPEGFFRNIAGLNFQDIAYAIAKQFLAGDLPDSEIDRISREAVNFPVPLVRVTEGIYSLELFHGPTLAFKDVGARFMSRLMSYLNRGENQKLTILVATSGDTGSAVAHGFYNVDGIEVIILYPSGKVSMLQEKQLTTLGGNISAVEVDGTFDDCQRLVKDAFLDSDLKSAYRLCSANSINIARLIPQSFYYVEAYRQLEDRSLPLYFSVPSGNFGNLCAGLIASRMGLPVSKFIAANNQNDSVCRYLSSGEFNPMPTAQTISNAMDVGLPSNFERMMDLYGASHISMKNEIAGFSYDDIQTRQAMKQVYKQDGYVLDPHGAVAWLGLQDFLRQFSGQSNAVFLETAHPAKFIDVVEETLQFQLQIPDSLEKLKNKEKRAFLMQPDFLLFKDFLNSRI